ncbi:MAG: amidophosphoribosyltransferase [Candidatus Lokiarchaeota archaeon]|nr:amidophosphoribosyltransferase [Candidatus Lokiarchaeota archaeon]MBD3201473.1 amidophosphoribosyltransferase [Candidatus Lokiarchaeota archaeon]
MLLFEDKVKEYCGIFGISCNDFNYSIAGLIYKGLMALQHRGQIFSGLSTTHCLNKIFSYKNKGIVSKVLTPRKLKKLPGNVGIGHVCSRGGGLHTIEDAQPYHHKSKEIEFSVSMNGIISNHDEILQKLENMGRIFTGNTDIELISTIIETFSRFSENTMNSLELMMDVLEGGYSLILLEPNGKLYALRDPLGFKPLCFGKLNLENRSFLIVTTESSALDVMGAELIRELYPGEILEIDPNKPYKSFMAKSQGKQKFCSFEYIYFARPDSIIENRSVFDIRYKLGRKLANKDKFDSDNAIVVPVPDSGRSAAMGYAWESGIPYQEGLIKNRYVWQLKVDDIKEKLNPIENVVNRKDIILIDDSILSGITMKKLISMLRDAGANSIHVRISAPPIINNCKFNNSFSNRDLLIAYQKKLQMSENYIEEIRKYIDADSLIYQLTDDLITAIGLNSNQICCDCFPEPQTKIKKKPLGNLVHL